MRYRFVFEDYIKDVLPSFYMLHFMDAKFIKWIGGNGHLLNYVTENKLFGDVYEIIYIDYNPWNKDIASIYSKMCKVIRRFGYHYIIIPIVCIEYQYLKSIDEKYLLDKDLLVKLKEVKSLSEIVNDDIKTYEQYCKYCAEKLVIDIASVDVDINKDLSYFKLDTFGDKLDDKWIKFIMSYSICPYASGLPINYLNNLSILSFEEIMDIHSKCIDYCIKWKNSVETDVKKELRKIDINWYK